MTSFDFFSGRTLLYVTVIYTGGAITIFIQDLPLVKPSRSLDLFFENCDFCVGE